MQKIIPNLWFCGNAQEAVNFYVHAFKNSKIILTTFYPKSSEEGLADFQLGLAGEPLTIDFELNGMLFTAINAGPEFKPNQSISFIVNFDPKQDPQASKHLDDLWNKFKEGGKILMPLKEYFFSPRYGFIQDKYGYCWQLILTNPEGEERPFIIPSLKFSGQNVNRAEEAINFYTSVFMHAKIGRIEKFAEAAGLAKAGSIMFADFMLENQWFAAVDSGSNEVHVFNGSVSFLVTCKDQAEIDYYWEQLSFVPEAEQCGWCTDKFGVYWQIAPANMEELMQKPNAFKIMMQQKKIIINEFK